MENDGGMLDSSLYMEIVNELDDIVEDDILPACN